MCSIYARLRVWGSLTLAIWLAGCAAVTGAPTPPIPTLTPAPTLTPTPVPALPPDSIWIGFDGPGSEVIALAPGGTPETVRLPLNEGQRASDVAAAADGSALAYLVWDEGGQQHGVAAWELAEPNARLVTQPIPGYRIIALYLTPDASRLITVEMQADKLPADADWRLQSVSTEGGEPTLLTSREATPDVFPPTPLGIASDGMTVFAADVRDAVEPGNVQRKILGIAPDTGLVTLVSRVEDLGIGVGQLSPDGTRLAYTAVGGTGIGVARVLNLQTHEVVTLAAPGGENITSLRWYADGTHLLLDVAPQGDEGRSAQFWARADVSQTTPWQQTSPDPARATLFTYMSYNEGVIYTLFPADTDTEWRLYLLADIAANSPPQPISLGNIQEEMGAPYIIRAP